MRRKLAKYAFGAMAVCKEYEYSMTLLGSVDVAEYLSNPDF